MSKMTQRDRVLLLIVGGLVVLGGLFKFYLSPAKSDRDDAVQRVSELQDQVQTAQTQLTALQNQAKGKNAAGAKQEVRLVDRLRLAKAYPDDRDIPATILQIEQIAKQAKVELGPATPDQGTDYAGVTGTAFTIDVTGRFFQVQDFMHRMNDQVSISPFGKLKIKGRLFAITQADLGPADGGADGSTAGASTTGASTTGASDDIKANLTVVVFSRGAQASTAGTTDVANTTQSGGSN